MESGSFYGLPSEDCFNQFQQGECAPQFMTSPFPALTKLKTSVIFLRFKVHQVIDLNAAIYQDKSKDWEELLYLIVCLDWPSYDEYLRNDHEDCFSDQQAGITLDDDNDRGRVGTVAL